MAESDGMMKNKTAARLAWILCAMVIVAAAVSLILSLRDRPADDSIFKTMSSMTSFAMFLFFAVTGALIVSRQPRNMVGWLLLIEASLVFVWPLDIYFNSLTQAPANPSLLTLLGLWIYGWLWLWFIFPILFIPLFFPTGSPPSPRWRWLVVLGLGLCLFFILFVTLLTDFVAQNDSWSVPNPIGFLPGDSFPIALWSVLLLSFAGLCVASLFVRYRRARKVEREQIKWLLYAAALFFVVYAISFVFNEVGGIIDELLGVILNFAILLLPTAIVVAILRYRLYDIDLIIRKTLVYALLSGLLALVYFGLVVLLQSVFESASGEQSPIAIVISTLVIAALFAPLRRRVQDFIDRRFFRKKYDAQQVLAQFAQTARDETDMERLTAELARVVQETMQPEIAGIWIKTNSS